MLILRTRGLHVIEFLFEAFSYLVILEKTFRAEATAKGWISPLPSASALAFAPNAALLNAQRRPALAGPTPPLPFPFPSCRFCSCSQHFLCIVVVLLQTLSVHLPHAQHFPAPDRQRVRQSNDNLPRRTSSTPTATTSTTTH